MSKDNVSTCQHCRFGEKNSQQIGSYFCRRRSPVAVPVQTPAGLSIMSVFPPMAAEGWCGDYERPPLAS